MKKHKLSSFLLLAPCSLLLLCPTAAAQLLGEFSTMHRTNFFIAPTITGSAAATYSGTNIINVERYANVGWEFTFAGSAANTNTITITFIRTADGTNYETSPLYTWTVTAQGTNIVRALTNLPAAPALYWKPYQITNSMATDVTNATLYGLKRSALVD